MFCFQCEQTAGCSGCTGKAGVCGKKADTANLQDQLTSELIGLAKATEGHEYKITDQTNHLMLEALFSTLTNVNFNNETLTAQIDQIKAEKQRISQGCAACISPCGKVFEYDIRTLWEADEDIRSMKSLILFGIRGLAAYAYHAMVLGFEDKTIYGFLYKALMVIGCDDLGMGELLPVVLEVGEINLKCMALLDQANTETYGHPVPTEVSLTVEKGPFIVITGHDLLDLKLLLEQTEGTGINIYTHGEMLPAHAYPELKKYSHLKGNFGTAWQNQQKEFADLPAPILFTTNCLMPPKDSYKDRVFTSEVVSFPGVTHITPTKNSPEIADNTLTQPSSSETTVPVSDKACSNETIRTNTSKDFSPVIKRALELGGYTEDKTFTGINGGTKVMTGFAHNTVLSVADQVIDAVKTGAIKHFFLVGGCDGARAGRNYFTEFVKQTPDDSVVLTLACGKYRFNDLDLGTIGGLPRLMDIGQCNDAYSAIQIAVALANAFGCGVNDLPLSMVLSWYEQKAVCILLTLLHLGIKNIRLGPTLPAFISPNVLNYLVEHYNIAPVTTPEEDLKAILG